MTMKKFIQKCRQPKLGIMGSFIPLVLTILLGILFSYIQYLEYTESSFNFSSGIYGSIFYILTGFHGIHVIIGTIMLIVGGLRMYKEEFT